MRRLTDEEIKEKGKETGYVLNCTITSKNGERLFKQHDNDTVTAHLDGYAIIPIEEYNKLMELSK